MLRPLSATILIFLLLILFGNCSPAKKKQVAESAVAKFHSQLDGRQFHDIYVQSGPEFQKSATEAEITEFLSAVHRKLGNVQSSKAQRFFVNFSTSGTIVTLAYDSQFANGPAVEEFVWRVSEEPRLVSYRINSLLLVTK